ncbi:nucleoporin Nup37-like isoform X1 [Saccostrea echinata]|uniref:nucleoporin Nup37-like isoform X1 n=2 Tax=Saccostrea echinata TaxID=191078 RepID=UPI002A806126|nr:nucleoporin Nup37-like isoform X1 [Saccostrea echinata]
MEQSSASTYNIPCHDIVNTVEFCPYDWCSTLLAVGTNSRVTIYRCRFINEEDEGEESMHEDFDFKLLIDIQNGCPVRSLSWSPVTSYKSYEQLDTIRIAAAGSDNRIKIFTTDLVEGTEAEVLEGHSDFINALTYNPENGDILASTGDDYTCRLWGNDGSQQACFQLSAPGMSVCIHEKESGKVVVAQKNGIIKMFSLDLQHQISSCDCGISPLMGIDWCREDEDIIGAVAGTEWLVFQLSRSSQPLERRQAHTDGVRDIKWCKSQPNLLATSGRPGRQIKVFNTRHHQVPLNTSLKVSYGMSWHAQLPVLAVGGDSQVHLYYIEPARQQT